VTQIRNFDVRFELTDRNCFHVAIIASPNDSSNLLATNFIKNVMRCKPNKTTSNACCLLYVFARLDRTWKAAGKSLSSVARNLHSCLFNL